MIELTWVSTRFESSTGVAAGACDRAVARLEPTIGLDPYWPLAIFSLTVASMAVVYRVVMLEKIGSNVYDKEKSGPSVNRTAIYGELQRQKRKEKPPPRVGNERAVAAAAATAAALSASWSGTAFWYDINLMNR